MAVAANLRLSSAVADNHLVVTLEGALALLAVDVMLDLVLGILLLATPLEVLESVVLTVSVEVTSFFAVGTRSDESLKNEAMNVEVVPLAVLVQRHREVRQVAWLRLLHGVLAKNLAVLPYDDSALVDLVSRKSLQVNELLLAHLLNALPVSSIHASAATAGTTALPIARDRSIRWVGPSSTR